MSQEMANAPTGGNTGGKEAGKKGGRRITIKAPDTGKDEDRGDFCRRVILDKKSPFYGNRGKIAAKLSEIENKDVKYQTVRAYTTGDEYVAAINDRKATEKAAKEAAKAASSGDKAA